MQPRVAIIYLCYGAEKYMRPVADAIANLSYPKDRLAFFVIPSGSPDNVASVIKDEILPRSQKDLPEVIVADDGVNRGFAGNNNPAIQQALDVGFDYVFLHNGD